MTVIAWDGKTLAADKLASLGTLKLTTTKIHRVGDCLVGYAGEPTYGAEMREWFRAGAKPGDFPASQRTEADWVGLLVIRPGGEIWRYERCPYPVIFQDRFIAIGSGRDFAMAAMDLGFDARRAVEVACARDSGCGNGIDTLTLEAQPDGTMARRAAAPQCICGAYGGPESHARWCKYSDDWPGKAARPQEYSATGCLTCATNHYCPQHNPAPGEKRVSNG